MPDMKTHDDTYFAPPYAALLRRSGLRATRQRLALAELLFTGANRHVSAEMLHREVAETAEHVSLATVYNTLHAMRRAGLLREVTIGNGTIYFDTNTSPHHHFYREDDGKLIDFPSDGVRVDGVPPPPDGARIARLDVVVRVRMTRPPLF